MNYYNEFDPKAAAWLSELISAKLIPNGTIDQRSISDVHPSDLSGFTQCHFFAGIGGWSLALRLAGFPDDRCVWTGSCPCQPFSGAGKQLGTDDSRHLWPVMRELIRAGKPPITFGEQVASKLGREWLAGVRSDLEAMGNEVGAADLCAASAGAPHIRQRLFWMAYASGERIYGDGRGEDAGKARCACGEEREQRVRNDTRANSSVDRVALSDGRNPSAERLQRGGEYRQQPKDSGDLQVSGMGNTNRPGFRAVTVSPELSPTQLRSNSSHWSEYDVLPFRDGKFRRVEAGTFPMAHGIPHRMGLLRGYGNAIVPQVASQFIKASLEAIATLTTHQNAKQSFRNAGGDV